MWNQLYKEKRFFWGSKPDPILIKFLPLIPKGKVLEIGAGEGRNSLFLASQGFDVEATDISEEGLKRCAKIAKKHHLPITIKVMDVRKARFLPRKYALIFSVATMSFLKRSEILQIMPKIKKALKKGGLVYLLMFTVMDPVFKKLVQVQKPIEKNTFYGKRSKCYRYFLEHNELRRWFNDFTILHYREYKKKDTYPTPHFHGIAEIVAKK